MELTLQKPKENGLKCNIEKSFFGKTEMEYLSSRETRNGVQTINNKVEAMVNMMPPNTTKHVSTLIVLLN